MDRKSQELLASSGWQNYMIKTYLYNQLSGMVRVFQGRYSTYMTRQQMAEELIYINELINNMEIKLVIPSITSLTHGLISDLSDTSRSPPIPKQINIRVANDINRCHARVWGNSKYLIWRLNNGRLVYGCQCKRSKSQGSQYCAKHSHKLTHEDWFSEPSDTMRRHFLKPTLVP
jgi:hypothetical protein